jgi:protein disulfide-isomerase
MNKMRKVHVFFWLAVSWASLSTAGFGQQPIRWEATLENAQQLAGQTNRLVLIHFWAPWCGACKKMETEVYNQPMVAGEIATDYVPVKINRDYFPATADRYGVTALPTTVITTPQGQVVDVIRGRIETSQYVARLGQVAAEVKRRNAAVYAQMPPRTPPAGNAIAGAGQPIPPQTSATPAAAIAAPNTQPSTNAVSTPSSSGLGSDRFAEYFRRDQASPSVGPALTGSMSSNPPPAAAISSPQPPQMASQGPALNPPSQPIVQPSGGNPPIGLDGFCPVTLCEKQQWMAGDRRWGAVHRGRTYLFTGPEEQRRFFADPDRFAPVMSGNDLVAVVEQGQTVPGMREYGVFLGPRVFLFASETSREKFEKNPNLYANYATEAVRASSNPGHQMQ